VPNTFFRNLFSLCPSFARPLKQSLILNFLNNLLLLSYYSI